jgi:hypothetical protein
VITMLIRMWALFGRDRIKHLKGRGWLKSKLLTATDVETGEVDVFLEAIEA